MTWKKMTPNKEREELRKKKEAKRKIKMCVPRGESHISKYVPLTTPKVEFFHELPAHISTGCSSKKRKMSRPRLRPE
jgi:hypothetical protein